MHDLDELILLFCPVVHVHYLAGLFVPLGDEGLARPAAARPGVAVVGGERAERAGPRGLELLLRHRHCADSAAVAEVVAAESEHSVDLGIGVARAEVYRKLGLVVIDGLAVNLYRISGDIFLRVGLIDRVWLECRQRRRGRGRRRLGGLRSLYRRGDRRVRDGRGLRRAGAALCRILVIAEVPHLDHRQNYHERRKHDRLEHGPLAAAAS